jgi:hypothetical protein
MLVVLIAVIWMALYTPPTAVPVTASQSEKARLSITAAQKTIFRVAKAASEGRRVPFQVRISEDDLTNFAATDPTTRAKLASFGMTNPSVKFRDGLVAVSGLKELGGRKVYITVVGKPEVAADGRLGLADIKVRMGKLGITSFAADGVKSAMDGMFRSGETRIPADISLIDARNGVLTLQGYSRPN